MEAIEIKGLTKRFKNRVAVDDLNLSVRKGEFFALLGQNGAGKTTTIRMLCCLTEPTSGDALLLGDSILTHPQAVRQKLNVSPQETAIAPFLSVRENLEFFGEIYGLGTEAAKERAAELMTTYGLSDRANDKAKTLSGGFQRRLSIAIGLVSDPDILFLDEPTLGLDVRARRELWKDLSALKGKKTIVLTTHYLEEAAALADRIAILDGGRLKALGTLQELKTATGKDDLEEIFLSLTEGGLDA